MPNTTKTSDDDEQVNPEDVYVDDDAVFDEDEPEEGEERCVSCGYIFPSALIEHLDDCYLGQCTVCRRG